MGQFGDHYSKQSRDYARYRPTYPAALYEFLISECDNSDLAWDCGAGNGQVACCLARHFQRVIATEPSPEQLSHAKEHERVEYRQTRAENSGLEAASVDLVTAGSAVHWFDIPAFYREVKRVCKPSALVAVWTYAPLLLGDSPLAGWMREYSLETVGEYWPPGRDLFFGEYKTLPFPFRELDKPALELTLSWTLEELLGWTSTWSATVRFQEATGQDPLMGAVQTLSELWPGEAEQRVELRLPLYWRVGRL